MTFEILPRYEDGSPKWHEQRRQGVGASDVAAILGESPFSTPYRVWIDKIGERWNPPKGEFLEWGHRAEPMIADWVRDKHPEIGHVSDGLDLRSVEYPWLTAKPDRVIRPMETYELEFPSGEVAQVERLSGFEIDAVAPPLVTYKGTGIRPLEIKTSTEWNRDEWEEVPLWYLYQVLTQCIVMGADRGYLAALIGGNSSRFFEVVVSEHQSKVDRILEETERFWQRVVDHDPPAPTDVDEAVHRWPGGTGGVIRCDVDLHDNLGAHVIAKADEKAAREDADRLKVAILSEIGDAEVIVTPDGEQIATYKQQSGRKRLDWALLEREYPEAYADCVSVGEPSRVLRINNKKLMED